jgi:hypothetical protein
MLLLAVLRGKLSPSMHIEMPCACRAGRYLGSSSLGSSSNAVSTACEPGEGGHGKKKMAKKRRVDELLIEQGLADDAKVGFCCTHLQSWFTCLLSFVYVRM